MTNEYFTNSGVPYDILKSEFYVPSSCARKECERYRGKKQFGEILDVKEATTLAYFKRLIEERIYFKKNLVPLMATESLATTWFLDSHPGQDFERKAGRESTTKLKDIGSCAVYICSSFFNVMVKDSTNM